jgi:glutathione S-transferase
MSDLVVYGFPRSTFVNIVRMVLTHKNLAYKFHDLEPEMGKPSHLQVAERDLADGRRYLLGPELTLADFYLLPSTFAFSLTDEGKQMYLKYPLFSGWRERMEALPAVKTLRASLPPRAPIEHAREWAISHRPKY